MTGEQLRHKQRLLAAAMRDGDYEVAEGLATELEPFMRDDEDDRVPAPIPAWGVES